MERNLWINMQVEELDNEDSEYNLGNCQGHRSACPYRVKIVY